MAQLRRRGEGEVEVGRRLVDMAESAAANQLALGKPVRRRAEVRQGYLDGPSNSRLFRRGRLGGD